MLKEDHRLKVSGNRIEVTGGWRKLHNEELHSLWGLLFTEYYYGEKMKEDGIRRACSMHGGSAAPWS
jgi:hypothetical protein